MILWYALLVVGRAIRFFLLWTVPTFIAVGSYFGSPTAGIVAGIVVWLLAYRHKIFARCVKCNGDGKFWDMTKSYYRFCPRCGGSGRAYRLGMRPEEG